MNYFLALHGTYDTVYIGLFQHSFLHNFLSPNPILPIPPTLIGTRSIANTQASKQLIQTIDHLLHAHTILLNQLDYIAVNQGPGPFTTLRTILTFVNSINFACTLPLIGIDSLKGLAEEWPDTTIPTTVVLLDAFNNDIYFCIHTNTHPSYQTGYTKIDALLTMLATTIYPHSIRFIGNAVPLYRSRLQTFFTSTAYFPEPLPTLCSLNFIGTKSHQLWQQHHASTQLTPLYLKKHQAEIAPPLHPFVV